ncbi:MAG TPA: ferrochelatase [Isosphaeraceae bacterium]|nr:ferrochelatase [Isosphaeraceae bacterium]
MTARGESSAYDAILVVGFGGPERREDVMPFLENVARGRNVPYERLVEVAGHYHDLGGASPINSQVRALIACLRSELNRRSIALPIFWGNRNWDPFLADTLVKMTAAGVKRALAVVLAAYSSYSSCRQYREDIARAQAAAGPDAPHVDKIRLFYNHPDFIAANSDRVLGAMATLGVENRDAQHLVFTAHSIPVAMARGCDYEQQLREACRLVAGEVGIGSERWSLVYQSRSGRPSDPWLEPDVLDHLRNLRSRGVTDVLIHPIGFLSDHMEVLHDLDVEARDCALALGIRLVRSQTVGTHDRFVALLGELIAERTGGLAGQTPRSVGRFGPGHAICPDACCLPPSRPTAPLGKTPGSA